MARAAREAERRGVRIPVAVADLRHQPFPDGSFDVAVCADNALPHLPTAADVSAALAELRRVLRPGGRLLASTRDYDRLRAERPASTPPQVHHDDTGRTVTFQLWHWHDDGERYDLEHVQLRPGDAGWQVRVRTTSYRTIGRDSLARLAIAAGFDGVDWLPPERTGFFQPILTARAT